MLQDYSTETPILRRVQIPPTQSRGQKDRSLRGTVAIRTIVISESNLEQKNLNIPETLRGSWNVYIIRNNLILELTNIKKKTPKICLLCQWHNGEHLAPIRV